MLFSKYKKRIAFLESQNSALLDYNRTLRDRELFYQNKINSMPSMAELMRESLGLSVDFASASNDECLPPHFLEGLSEEERKNFIVDMETVYSNDRFQTVVRYMINLFATNAIYKADKDEMKNGQIAVVALRTLLKKFNDMHKEFLSYKKSDEGFDDQEILPE